MAEPKKPELRSRYSIGEWYGTGFEKIPIAARFRLAKSQWKRDALTGMPSLL